MIIDDITHWLSQANYEETDALENLINDIRNNKFTIYATAGASDITNSGHNMVRKLATSGVAILLGGSFNDHYGQFEATNLGYSQQSEQLPPYCGYLIQKRKAVAFKAVYTGGDEYGL